jgi:predicted transcriptional regulator
MTALKEEVMTLVERLPDSTTLDDILAEIYFKAQIDQGLRELDNGKGISHEAVEKRLSKWLPA